MTAGFLGHLDTIAEELDRFEVALEGHLDGAVPSCPDWRGRDLAWHVLRVLDRWTLQVRAADPEHRSEVEPRQPSDDELFVALGDQGGALIDAFATAGPESPCWSFFPEGRTTGWVARRCALELAVHRVDAELVAGVPTAIDRELAVEGIEERIAIFATAKAAAFPERSLGGSLCLVCEDAPAAWLVEAGGGSLRWRPGRMPADAAVVASASRLFLFTWDRVPLEEVQLTGDAAVARAWRALLS